MPRLTPSEQDQLKTYFEVIRQYRELPPLVGLPWIGVRLTVLRYGFQSTLGALKNWGEDIVADRAMDQLRDMARLWFKQISSDPPASEVYDSVMQSVHLIWNSTRDPAVRARIFQIVSRMRIREAARAEAAKPKFKRVP